MISAGVFPTASSNIAPGFQARVESDGTVDKEVLRLRSKNDLFGIYQPEWELYLAAYEGGPSMCTAEMLCKHARENEHDFDDRVKRVHYMNYCAPLVDFFTNFIYTETISRNGGANDKWYQEFIQNVNRKGDTVDDFGKMAHDDANIFGMSYVLVDTPLVPGLDGENAPLSAQEQEEQGIYPYWVLIKPDEVVDWATDEFEALTYVKRVQPVTKPTREGHRFYEKYTEWFTDEIVISMVDVTEREKPTLESQTTLPNTLGEIPIHIIRYKRSKQYRFMGNSFLRDFAYNNREVMRYTSLLQEFLYRQGFNVLAKEAESIVPTLDAEDGSFGTSNIIEFPKGGVAPTYISPPVAPAQFIQGERQRIVEEMFKQASQDMMSELQNGEGSSGFSQAQSFSKTVPFIATRADMMEKAENALMVLTMKLMNKKWDGSVKYKDRYELTNVTDKMTQLLMLFRDLQMPSETFVKIELKRLVQELDGKIAPDDLAKIFSEIEKLDFPEWQQVQQEALVGKGAGDGQSPGAQQKDKNSGTIAESAAEARSGTAATKKPRSK